VGDFDLKQAPLLFPEHHLSHAASAFYPSPFEEAAILTVDGVGEWATSTIAHGRGKDITILKEMSFPHSIGLLYAAFTFWLGFRVNSGEYKVMGLAPYANRESPAVLSYRERIMDKMVTVYDDGSLFLDQRYFRYATGLRMLDARRWEHLFGWPKRQPDENIEQRHADLAMACQLVTEEAVLKMAIHAQQVTGSRHLCLAGGVALNCVSNACVRDRAGFDDIFVQPAAGDAGGAVGGALAGFHIYFKQERQPVQPDGMSGSFLGPAFGDTDLASLLKPHPLHHHVLTDNELFPRLSSLLADGAVVGWFHGRMEFGPRALGNRSILADPRRPDMTRRLNAAVKFREAFRPFAPTILAEHMGAYFEGSGSPYMTLVNTLVPSQRMSQAGNDAPDIATRLGAVRSEVPAVTHVDHSARVQVLDETTNPRFHRLLTAWYELTGCPMLINTSFNVRGEPIVCSPDDAISCFMKADIDHLVIENTLISKR
jgi:carbamoyltransferase